MAVERVLIVGATGNIGVSAALGALSAKREVLAIVRNNNSAEKFFKHVGTREGITTTEANVLSEAGVQSVVDQVEAGKLPPFQHVYATVGVWRDEPMHEISNEAFRDHMRAGFEANFFAYRATIPYLLKQNNPNSTFTVCVGASDSYGAGGVTAITQGALVSMANAAMRQNMETNIRVNEAYLNARVEYDADAEKSGANKASDYSKVYKAILERKEIDGARVKTLNKADMDDVKFEKKLTTDIWG